MQASSEARVFVKTTCAGAKKIVDIVIVHVYDLIFISGDQESLREVTDEFLEILKGQIKNF